MKLNAAIDESAVAAGCLHFSTKRRMSNLKWELIVNAVGLLDLDELVLRCRTKEARSYLNEAVACYKAGAYRSAIIATWIAVIFDFVSKLRELEMTGDNQAKSKLETFDAARKANEPGPALAFERSVVQSMRDDFGLLSHVEAVDFDRLFEDRNRCAHPSMVSAEEPFQPTAELARTHIASAVTGLLQHPPVQGKAALERIWTDIQSEYFPKDKDKARTFLSDGPLQRARPSLVRSFVIGISKDLLHKGRGNAERLRQYAALNAVLDMHYELGVNALKESLPTVLGATPGEHFNKAIRYMANVNPAWDAAGEAAHIRAINYVEQGPTESLHTFLPYALAVPQLRDAALSRISEADDETLAKAISRRPDSAFSNEAVSRFAQSGSWRSAERRLSDLVLPLAQSLTAVHLDQIAEAFEKNDQVTWASGVAPLLVELLKRTQYLGDSTKTAWNRVFNVLITHEYFKEGARGTELKTALKLQFGFFESEEV